ncbi:hypothetical protein BGW38_008756, partial [Lunasporangiospora selenospora]
VATAHPRLSAADFIPTMKKLFGGKSKDKKPNGHSSGHSVLAPSPPSHQSLARPNDHHQTPSPKPTSAVVPAAQPVATSMQFTSLAGTSSHQNGNSNYSSGGYQPMSGYPPTSMAGGGGGAGPPGYAYNQPYPNMPQPPLHNISPPPSSTGTYPPARQQSGGPSSFPTPTIPYHNPLGANGSAHAPNLNGTHRPGQPVAPLGFPAIPGLTTRTNGEGRMLTGDPKEDYPIVMAIDFGTTFTGCAFAFRKDPEIQEIITW